MARERVWDPRVLQARQSCREFEKRAANLVSPVPDRDANATRDIHARLHHILVVLRLLSEQSVCSRERHPDVELRNRNLQSERGELLHGSLEGRGDGPDDEVALETDAVDGDPIGNELLDEVEHRGGL